MSESESLINLESLQLQIPNKNEVQYVYDDSDLNLEDINPEDISEVMLADGSRAVLINGNIIPCLDTQSIVLQDGPELSQYYISDETLGRTQQNTLGNLINSSEVIQYIDNSTNIISKNTEDIQNDQEVVYVNDEIYQLQEGTDLSEYRIAEVQPDENSFAMKTVQFGDQIIDLEGLVKQQVALKTDNLSYQYAVLKDGKLHLQNFNPTDLNELKSLTPDDQDTDTNNSNLLLVNEIAGITGKDWITGETVTLDSYINKMKKKRQHKNMYKVKREEIRDTNASATKKRKKSIGNTTPSTSQGLHGLLNKKIPLGQTEDGKLLVGKIVTIKKKDQSKQIDKNKLVTINIDDSEEEGSSVKTEFNELSIIQGKTSMLEDSSTLSPLEQQNDDSPEVSSKDVTYDRSTSPLDVKSGTTNSAVGISDNSESPKKIVIHEKFVTKDCFQHISRTLAGLMNMESVKKKLSLKNIVVKVVEKTYNDVIKGYTKKLSYSSGYMAEEYVIGEDNQMHEVWKFVPDLNTKEALFGSNSESDTEWSGYVDTTNVTVIITLERSGERVIRVVLDPNSSSVFKCPLCSKAFGTKVQLRVHVNNAHNDKGNSQETQENHNEEVTQFDESIMKPSDGTKYIFECEKCNKKFFSIARLLKHKNRHLTRIFDCPTCPYRCSTEQAIKEHLLTHKSGDLPGLPCYVCGSSFHNFDALNIHKRTHEPYKHFACKICGRSFSRQSNLQRHVAIHKGDGAFYRCVICGCSYHYISSLTRHVVQNHIDVSRQINSRFISEMGEEDSSNTTETVIDVTQQMEEEI